MNISVRHMQLKIITPVDTIVDTQVVKIIAEAVNGCFGLLPRHIDFVTTLGTGILTCVTLEGNERFIAVDEGVLVKCGRMVTVTTRKAQEAYTLKELHNQIDFAFKDREEHEAVARAALARLEIGFMKHFMDWEKYP